MTDSDGFLDIFFKKYDLASERLAAYLDEPNKENIHGVRISIRCLESAYSIFPKSSKSKSSEKYMKKSRVFFSKNSKIRDLDIILKKLSEHGYESESKLVLTLQKKRLERIYDSISLAEEISELKPPKIKSGEKISKKFDKVIPSLICDFKKYLPRVIGDESNVNEMHALRKKAKRLRYVLELKPDDSVSNLILNMKKLQKFLGQIHDCDIFIRHLEKIGGSDLDSIINSEKIKRHKIYENFVLSMSGKEI